SRTTGRGPFGSRPCGRSARPSSAKWATCSLLLSGEAGALFGLDLRVRRTLGAVGADDRAHDEPEEQANEHGWGERVDGRPHNVFRHEAILSAEECDDRDDDDRPDERDAHDESRALAIHGQPFAIMPRMPITVRLTAAAAT